MWDTHLTISCFWDVKERRAPPAQHHKLEMLVVLMGSLAPGFPAHGKSVSL